MALNKDAILKHAGTRQYEEVHIPAWKDENGDDTVRLHGLTLKEFEIHQARLARESNSEKDPQGDANARLIARCVVDDSGRRVFTDDDVNLISNLSLGDTLKLTKAIDKASGLGAEAEADARGESEPTPLPSSSSD